MKKHLRAAALVGCVAFFVAGMTYVFLPWQPEVALGLAGGAVTLVSIALLSKSRQPLAGFYGIATAAGCLYFAAPESKLLQYVVLALVVLAGLGIGWVATDLRWHGRSVRVSVPDRLLGFTAAVVQASLVKPATFLDFLVVITIKSCL